jgi:superfamily II RNA helicase
MLHVRDGPCLDAPAQPAIQLKYVPDEFQKHAFAAIESGHHLLVTAHTGSGKTTVAEYAVGRAVRDGGRVIYTSPIKALSNQIFGDFHKKYPDWDIGIKTGDIDLRSDAQIVIMTTEILRNMLYGGGLAAPAGLSNGGGLAAPAGLSNGGGLAAPAVLSSGGGLAGGGGLSSGGGLAAPAGLPSGGLSSGGGLAGGGGLSSGGGLSGGGGMAGGGGPSNGDLACFNGVTVVIFDEVHYIKDPDRGRVWEESIIMMPPGVQMILLSATLPDAQEFGGWVARCKCRDVTYVTTVQRVVPLNHYIMLEDRRVLIMDNSEKFNKQAWLDACKSYSFHPPQLNMYVSKLDLPAMFFSFSRQACEQYAGAIQTSLVDSKTATEIDHAFHQMIRKFDQVYEVMEQTIKLRNLLCKGVGYHHAGLLPALKEIVQELFARGLIKVLFVTETFAAGVNLPAKTVVFTGLTKYDSTQRGFRPLRPEEYRQMAGRAGRRGMDKIGHVIILPFKPEDLLSEVAMDMMLAGRLQKITSQFRIDYNHILRMLVAGRPLDAVMSESMMSGEFLRRKQYYQSLLPDAELALATCISEAEGNLLRQHARLLERQELLPMLDQKSRKAHQRAIKELPVSFEVLKELQSRRAKADKALRDIQQAVEYYDRYAQTELYRIQATLLRLGYIDNVNGQPTVKGIECAQINECAAITLIEGLHLGIFNDLSTAELLGTLAFFLAAKEDEERETEECMPGKIRVAIRRLRALHDSHEEIECLNEPLTGGWCDLAYVWVTEGRICCGKVFLGEFVRNMLKLANIARELLAAACVGQHNSVMRSLDGSQGLIVKSIVSPQSLYVN